MTENYTLSPDAGFSDMSPADYPELYHSLLLGDTVSPGTVTLSGHDRVENWDIQAAKGTTGASSKLNGRPLGEFTATFYLADNDDRAAWKVFRELIESTVNGPKPIALPIYHPDLAANRFTEVVKRSVGGMTWDGKGGCTVVVKFGEHAPPKPKPAARATSSPTAPGGNDGTTPDAPDPLARQRAELAELTAIARQP
jgi:hypothetical protein